MAWRSRGLLGVVGLVGLVACGVSRDEAVRLKDGQTLGDPGTGLIFCTAYGCPYEGQGCLEVFFEYGRSPAVCVDITDVCNRVECETAGKQCAVFDGLPGQVKCKDPDD